MVDDSLIYYTINMKTTTTKHTTKKLEAGKYLYRGFTIEAVWNQNNIKTGEWDVFIDGEWSNRYGQLWYAKECLNESLDR